jgi:phosphatidylserine/phosphatidylglycerophosphate/cardiolipin synthase-like enzyme
MHAGRGSRPGRVAPARPPAVLALLVGLLLVGLLLDGLVLGLVVPSGAEAAVRSGTSSTAGRAHHAATTSPHHDRRRARAAARKRAAHKAARRAAARHVAARRAAARRAAARRVAARRAAARKARWARVLPRHPGTWIRWSPAHADPPAGPRFNNPYGSDAQGRALVDQVIRAIDSSPGYRRPRDRRTHRLVPCPSAPRFYPSSIRIAVYSIADKQFADALVAAQRRCVSVQVLMNSHLTAVTSPSWRSIIGALGPRGAHYRHRRSFAHRCSNGCLGTAVLHSKFYLFSRSGRAHDTVMVGSSNMARNATKIQWNDLYTVSGDRRLFSQYRRMFALMVPDHADGRPHVFRDGRYTSVFYPYRRATVRSDDTMRALRSIHCAHASGGTGIGGRTVLYVAMHSWHGERGHYLAQRVRQMYDRGCYVRVLYSFMALPVYSELTWGTGPRMLARRVLFPGPAGVVAAKYSHLKMFAASGNVAGDRSAKVVWTGSNNWTDRGLRADEVTLRIASASVYDAYVRHWRTMLHRRSSAFWATYEEPVGGGRAP